MSLLYVCLSSLSLSLFISASLSISLFLLTADRFPELIGNFLEVLQGYPAYWARKHRATVCAWREKDNHSETVQLIAYISPDG